MGIRGCAKIFPVLLRMVHQSRLQPQLSTTYGILRHQSGRVYVQLRRDSPQVPRLDLFLLLNLSASLRKQKTTTFSKSLLIKLIETHPVRHPSFCVFFK